MKIEGNGKEVYVAVSGGVDSAVAAAILIERGYEVTGVFMKNWSGESYGLEKHCPWREDQESAANVCHHLNIPFKTYNFEKEYRENIISYFFNEYRKGRTPNPDVLCNQIIKFGAFLDRSTQEGADFIATGHYAGVQKCPDGSYNLLRPADRDKDQTYFLYRLNQQQLAKTIFPLERLTKPEVRKIALSCGLPNARRKDSQGICFLGKIDISAFLEKEITPEKGSIVDIDTDKIVGEHRGIWNYTLGQREGIGIGGIGEPYFVARKDRISNTLYVARGKENPHLYIKEVSLENIHFINKQIDENTKVELTCQLRYRQKPVECSFCKSNIELHEPVWLTAEGQSAVLYDGEVVVGGGVISRVEGISR